jgi:hypothetical protein
MNVNNFLKELEYLDQQEAEAKKTLKAVTLRRRAIKKVIAIYGADEGVELAFPCKSCPRAFGTQQGLTRHTNAQHAKVRNIRSRKRGAA